MELVLVCLRADTLTYTLTLTPYTLSGAMGVNLEPNP